MGRLLNYKLTNLTYDKALELYNKLKKVRGYPESYRRFDQHYRVAVKDDVECGGYIDFWQFESYTTAKEIRQELYMLPQSKDDIPLPKHSLWHEDERHGYTGESSHRNSKSYAFFVGGRKMNGLVRVYKNGFIMASTGSSDMPNTWGRNFVCELLNMDSYSIKRYSKYDYLEHGGKYYCSNYQGLEFQDGYLVNAYRPSKVNSKFYTNVDFKKYDAILEPYYSWVRDVMSTCTDGKIPEFEPVGLNWEDFAVRGEFERYMTKTIDKLKNGECTDEDYLDLTCVLLRYAENKWDLHGALNLKVKDAYIRGERSLKFLPMNLLRNNVAQFFTLNDGSKEMTVYTKVEIGKRAWGTEYSHDHWIHHHSHKMY